MTLLVVCETEDATLLRTRILESLPSVKLRVWPDLGAGEDVIMMAMDENVPLGLFPRLPNLKCIQFLGHGAADILAHPEFPTGVAVCRLKDPGIIQWTMEYVLTHIFHHRWHVFAYKAQQQREQWKWHYVPAVHDTRIGVLGLGAIGGRLARTLAGLGFQVSGWARGPHNIENVKCYHGREALKQMLSKQDYVVCILPGTATTQGLLSTDIFDAMKQGAHFVNVGRGSVVDPDALVKALDSGPLGSATLDVFATEPLPAGSPLWRHPKVTVTPHIAGGKVTVNTRSASRAPMDSAATTAENYRRLLADEGLLNVVNSEHGY